MNKKEQRHQNICNLLIERDHLSVPELCAILNCSEATIRNDLRELEDNSMVKRIYGGVIPTGNTPHKVPYPTRQFLHNDAKDAIADYVVRNILQPGQTIILDAGTTTISLAARISELPFSLTILTNSLPCAYIISQKSNHKLHIAGGSYDYEVGSCHDQQTIDYFSLLHADIFFLCPTGISLGVGFAVPDHGGAEVKRAMIRQASTVIALADHSKFNKTGLHIICGLSEVDCVVTDHNITADDVGKFQNAGLNIKTAPAQTTGGRFFVAPGPVDHQAGVAAMP